MKMCFRYFNKEDNISLTNIRQIPGISGVVSAIYSVPVGEIWPEIEIIKLVELCKLNGLEMEVIESVPVHEDIKLRRGNFQLYIDNYKKNISLLARHGVKCICYNFMPVFDWTRSQLDTLLSDGSKALAYYQDQVAKLDPVKLSLPGWDASYSCAEVSELMEAYKVLGEEGLWSNLAYFLSEIMPVAIENDVKMAIHPDDPPWPIFGIPRIITSEKNIDRFLEIYNDPHNGLTLCSGSLGCSRDNDVVAMIKKYGKMNRIHFAHIRNILILEDGSFEESAHFSKCGSLDIFEIMKAYYEVGFDGYIRPDHGRMIWGEVGKPGYGLYDRALGAMYLNGIWEALEKMEK